MRERIERRRLDPAKNLRPSLSSLTLIPRNRGGEGILRGAKRKTERKRNVNPAERRHRTNLLLLATYASKPMIAFEMNHLEGHLHLRIMKVDQVKVRRQQLLQLLAGASRTRKASTSPTTPKRPRKYPSTLPHGPQDRAESSRICRSYTLWRVD
jgi:hypothetical protein